MSSVDQNLTSLIRELNKAVEQAKEKIKKRYTETSYQKRCSNIKKKFENSYNKAFYKANISITGFDLKNYISSFVEIKNEWNNALSNFELQTKAFSERQRSLNECLDQNRKEFTRNIEKLSSEFTKITEPVMLFKIQDITMVKIPKLDVGNEKLTTEKFVSSQKQN